MKASKKLRLNLRAQNIIFVCLVLSIAGVIGFITATHNWQSDWTKNESNSLTHASIKALATLDSPVSITVFVRPDSALKRHIKRFLDRYKRTDKNIHISFVNPDTQPQRVRALNITANGELYIQYKGRASTLTQLTETGLTNALVSISRTSNSKVFFLSGHGERRIDKQRNFDYSQLGKKLQSQGFNLNTVNLANTPSIPSGTALLVVASPQTSYLPGEIKIIKNYLKNGGNILWLRDPGPTHGLKPLSKNLGITFPHGTIVDATSKLFGLKDPTLLVLSDFPQTPVTQHLTSNILLPGAGAIIATRTKHWKPETLLKSRALPRSWLESGPIRGEIAYNKKSADLAGPVNIAEVLSRPLKKPAEPDPQTHHKSSQKTQYKTHAVQRVAVIADGDFLSNTYIGNAGNLKFGLALFNWLTQNNQYINIHVPTAQDKHLTLSATEQIILSVGFLFILPIVLLSFGGTRWYKRRKK